jgi:probable addiction module antidote protein
VIKKKILKKQKAIGMNIKNQKKTAKRQYRDYQEYLIESLKDPEEAIAYLNACLEDEDERVFLMGLKDVLEAQGGDMSALAQEANLNRPSLYRMLSTKGNPRWNSLVSLFDAMGLQMSLTYKK